jgi:hypothetical protein
MQYTVQHFESQLALCDNRLNSDNLQKKFLKNQKKIRKFVNVEFYELQCHIELLKIEISSVSPERLSSLKKVIFGDLDQV